LIVKYVLIFTDSKYILKFLGGRPRPARTLDDVFSRAEYQAWSGADYDQPLPPYASSSMSQPAPGTYDTFINPSSAARFSPSYVNVAASPYGPIHSIRPGGGQLVSSLGQSGYPEPFCENQQQQPSPYASIVKDRMLRQHQQPVQQAGLQFFPGDQMMSNIQTMQPRALKSR